MAGNCPRLYCACFPLHCVAAVEQLVPQKETSEKVELEHREMMISLPNTVECKLQEIEREDQGRRGGGQE